MDLCNKCDKRASCIELCPRAREYVNQDYTKRNWREQLECERKIIIDELVEEEYPEPTIELNTQDWIHLLKNSNMTKLQRKYIYLHYWKHLTYTNIAKRYGVSRQNITEIIKTAEADLAFLLIV